MKIFFAKGFFNNKSQTAREFPVGYDGLRLDELTLTATLLSMKDVEDLIKYLEIQRHCFWTPEDNERRYGRNY